MARRHESRVSAKLLLLYGFALATVVAIGSLAIWSFIEKQSLVIAPEPLPKVTVVTADSRSPLAAAWVRLLTKAEMSPTLVPIDKFDPIEGVVVFCDIETIPPRLAELLDIFVHRGGALVFVGQPPATPIGTLRLTADAGISDDAIQLSEAVSPLLARLNPGYELRTRRVPVAFLKETPRMVVDARWRQNSRAVVMHTERNGARYLWFGLDPNGLIAADRQLMLMLRTSFRWVAGQPISDGAIGAPEIAATLTPDARREARANRFAFSVDRMSNDRLLSVRMTNRGKLPLTNPTVKIWLPPSVTRVKLAGDLIMKRNATLTGLPEEGAVLVTLPRLTRNEDRVMKLKILETRAPGAAPQQTARK